MKKILALLVCFLCFQLSALSFAADIDCDADSNGAMDIAKGGTNATTAANARTALGLGTMAEATATDYVAKALFDAYTMLYADTDNTPAALTVGASTIVGRKATGGIVALTGAEALAIAGAQAALTYPVTGIASPTAGNLVKWGASGNTLADSLKIGTFTDGKWCSYSTASGLQCTETAPAGSGDVTGVGNCTGGDCLDGTSDGGTTIELYAGTANKVTFGVTAGGLGADKLWLFPATCSDGSLLKATVSGDTWTTSCVTSLTGLTFGGFTASRGIVSDGSGNLAVTSAGLTLSTALTIQTGAVTLTGNAAGSTLVLPSGSITLGTMAAETATSYVAKALFDAYTILYATTDNTPAALSVTEQTVVGRVTGGAIAALAIDSDLASVSANHDTVPSAKAVKNRIQYKSWSFDPKAVCDGAVDRLFLMSAHGGQGVIVTAWKISFEADPTTEADLDLKRADAWIGVANAAVMDVLDTTAGAASEATAANINGGAAVAEGKVIYLEFGTAYTETTHQIIFEMWFYEVGN